MSEPIKIVVYVEGGLVTSVMTSMATPEVLDVRIVDLDDGGDEWMNEEDKADLKSFEEQCLTEVY